jgi:hypothetical protein
LKDSSYLRGHRAFGNLKPADMEGLARLFSVLQCRPGACLIPQGSPVEGLYLVEKGMVRTKGPDKEEELFRCGDILNGESLFSPCAASGASFSVEESRILYLDRRDFLHWKESHPGAVKRLNLPGITTEELKPAILRENYLYWAVKSLPSLLFPPLLLARLFLRRKNGAFVEGQSLILRYFRWKSLKNTNLTIPLEQIQSVEVIQKGPLSRLCRTGHLLVRVNGTEGHALVKNIPRPIKEQERILLLKRRNQEAAQARKHREIRRDIARWIQKEEGVTLLEKGGRSEQGHQEQAVVFRKSLFVLFPLVWWQILLSAGCGALFYWGTTIQADWLFLPLIGWAVFLFLIIYQLADWANDLYKVEKGMLLDVNRKPLGKEKSQRQAELGVIQNVIAEQKGLWANLFDFGNIRIILPGSEGAVIWEGIKNPRRAQEQILLERRASMEIREEKERRSQQEDLMLYCRFISQELSEKDRS